MKTQITTLIIMLAAVAAMAQPSLTFRFANPEVIPGNPDIFQFDIQVKASESLTFHRDMQFYFDYNPLAFGENIVLNERIEILPNGLLAGSFAGLPVYKLVRMADNTSSRLAFFTEAAFSSFVAGPDHFAEVPQQFTGIARVRIEITDDSYPAGIYFAEERMDGGEYYQAGLDPIKYMNPNSYEDDLLEASLYFSGSTESQANGREIDFRAYPNPAKDYLNLDMPAASGVKADLYDMAGALKKSCEFSHTFSKQKETINISELPDGIYFLKLDADGHKKTIKVVKQ